MLGKPYRLGADGADPDGAVDCIHLVYMTLTELGIEAPTFNPAWYASSRKCIARELLRWGTRVEKPEYDGDVLLLPQAQATFAVTWNRGCLYINQHSRVVAWCPIGSLPTSHCFRSKNG
jgi:cell wall-associated NlpC family hydrolase